MQPQTVPNGHDPLSTGRAAAGEFAMQPDAAVAQVLLAAAPAAAEAEPGAQAPARLLMERPTYIVALGGAGRRIATRAKADLIERFGCLPANVVIHAFDGADDPVSVRERRHGEVVMLERAAEYFLLEPVPLGGIKLARDRHPEIVACLGPRLDRIWRAVIQDGCAQERPQGFLQFVWNAAFIRRTLQGAVHSLVQRDGSLRAEVSARPGINVVVCGSAPGAQASGAMLPLGFMLRDALSQLGGLGGTSTVIAMVVLPQAFHGVRNTNFGGNTHGFFLELDAAMRGGGIDERYRGGVRVLDQQAPFEQVLVLDGVDEEGRAWAGLDDVCEVGARAVNLLLGSAIGSQVVFNALNNQGVLHDLSCGGYGTYLGSVGQAAIRFPAQWTADRCTLRSARELALAMLVGEAAQPALPGFKALAVQLRLSEAGAPPSIEVARPPSLDQASPEEKPDLARRLIHNFVEKRLHAALFEQIQRNQGRATAALRKQLDDELDRAGASGSLAAVSAGAAAALALLATAVADAQTESELLAGRLAAAREAQDAASRALDAAAGSFRLGRKVATDKACDRYLATSAEVIRLWFDQRAASGAAAVLREAGEHAAERRRQAEAALASLRRATELLDRRAAEMAGLATPGHELNLAENELVEQLYAAHAPDLVTLSRTIAAAEPLLAWGGASAETLAARVVACAAPAFEPIRRITVEQVLASVYPERSARQWISRLGELAAAAWNLNPALLPGEGLAEFVTVGVPDAACSLFKGCGETLVSTHDPERIVVLRAVYGASYDVLQQARAWREAFEARRGAELFHLVRSVPVREVQ